MATVLYNLTTRMASLTDYAGVVTGTLANNTARQANRAAIQAAIDDCAANNKILVVPKGTYEIHNAGLIIGSGFRWLGTMESRIIQYSLNLPVLHVGPALGTVGQTVENTIIDGAYLRYSGTATAGGNALEMNGAYMCTFKNLQIGDVQAPYSSRTSVPYIGVYCDDATGTTPCFSCTWESVRIKHFGYRGFSADRLNYEAATGNVWTNLYIGGGNASGTQDLSAVANSGALVLGSQAQAVFNQINIEWMATPSVIRMVVCDQTVFNGVNFEGIVAKLSSSGNFGFFDIYNGSVTVEGCTINNCTLTAANNIAAAGIFRLGPATVVRANNFRPLLMTATANFFGVLSNSATNSRVDWGQMALGNSDGLLGYDDSTFASGAGNGYGLLSDFNGATVRTLADSNATLYSYRGDSVVRIPASTTRTLTLARQCTASITARIPPGTRKRIKNTGAGGPVTVLNYNAGSLSSTIAAGAFAEYVFDGIDWQVA